MEMKACHLSVLEERKPYALELNGTEVGIILLDNEVYAYENFCPHLGGPVCLGDVFAKNKLELDERKMVVKEYITDDDLRLVCPWHGFEYDVKTGESDFDSRFKLRKFDAYIKDDQVYVDMK